jgi:hypothetical protein
MHEYLCQELQEDILNSIFSFGRRMSHCFTPSDTNAGDHNGAFNNATYRPVGVGATNPTAQEPQRHVDSRVVSLGDHDGQQQDYHSQKGSNLS